MARRRIVPTRNEKRILAHFGEHLRALRAKKGWTQYDLADKSGLDQTYISRLEKGEANCSFRVLLMLASGFRIPVGTLCEGLDSVAPASPKKRQGARRRL